MRAHFAGMLVAVSLVLMACAIGGLSLGSSSGRPYELDFDAEPIPITQTAEASRAVSAQVSVEGGTITASGSDGTRYTLTIPAGALVEETTITMTPLAAMDGIPFGDGTVYAVDLEPAGLHLFDFATLTIVSPGPVSPEELIPVGTSGNDDSLEMPLAVLEGGQLQIKLLHFSSAGATKGLLADLEPYRQRLGGDVESSLRSYAATILAYERQNQLAGGIPETFLTPSFYAYLLDNYRQHVINPRVEAASESCAAGRLAIQTLFEVDRTLQLLGHPVAGEFTQEAWGLLPTVARRCLTEEYELCRDEHIIHRMIPALLTIQRQSELLGMAGGEMDAVLAEGENLARRCLHFELYFHSTAQGDITGPTGNGTFNSEVEANVPIQLEGSLAGLDFKLTGTSTLNNLDFEFQASTEGVCSTEEVPGPGTFSVTTMDWDDSPPNPANPYGVVTDIKLTYAPGTAGEAIIMHCPQFTSPPVGVPAWSTAHLAVHMGEIAFDSSPGLAPSIPDLSGLFGGGQAGSTGGLPPLPGVSPGGEGDSTFGPKFKATGWQIEADDLFAEKEWDLSTTVDGSTLSEAGRLELYHKPQ